MVSYSLHSVSFVLCESVLGQGLLQIARKKKKKLENRKVLREEEEKINDECFSKVRS